MQLLKRSHSKNPVVSPYNVVIRSTVLSRLIDRHPDAVIVNPKYVHTNSVKGTALLNPAFSRVISKVIKTAKRTQGPPLIKYVDWIRHRCISQIA
ncbi:hypothetical protein GJ496_004938 [Pomphorhynchus laevis]|nr:hypothetical protein GJ496_004938 [Pomphorhynchus laevis]